MKKIKYRGRKKYTVEEAGLQIENITQLLSTVMEVLIYWKTQPQTRADKLIQALVNKTLEEQISDNEEQVLHLSSKLKYMYKFAPNYKLKGSFGIM